MRTLETKKLPTETLETLKHRLESDHIHFRLFGAMVRSGIVTWNLIVSGDWGDEEKYEVLKKISLAVTKQLTESQAYYFGSTLLIDPRSPFYVDVMRFYPSGDHPEVYRNIELGGLDIDEAVILVAQP